MSPGSGPESAAATVAHVLPGRDRSGLFTGIARHVDRARFRLEYWCTAPVDDAFRRALEGFEVAVVELPEATTLGLPRLTTRIVREVGKRRPAALHGHMVRESAATVVAARLTGVPAVVTRHHSDYHRRAGQWRGTLLDRIATGGAKRVIAVSEHVRREMIDHEGAPAERVVTVVNGVDVERVPEVDPARRDRLRAEFGMAERPTAVQVGRLHEEKGQADSIDAIELLRGRGVELQLLLVGDGPAGGELQERVKRLGLQDRVRFLGFRSDAVDLMAAADVVLLPSRAEAFGLVAVEAMATGSPLIAARRGGLEEVLTGRPGATLVPAGDPEAIASALAALPGPDAEGDSPGGGVARASDGDVASRVAGDPRAILDDFSMAEMVRGYERVWSEVVS